MNSCVFLTKIAQQRPDEPAIRFRDEVISYRQFLDRALGLAASLSQRGLRPGDRVAFVLPNGPAILETIYGCFAAGLIVVPINARLHPREIAYIVQNSGARVLIYGPEYHQGLSAHAADFAGVEHRVCTADVAGADDFAELLLPSNPLSGPVDVGPEDPAWLFYTSGTTGRPKGATWTHRTIRTVVMNYLADVHNIQPGEVVLHAAPMSHGGGIVSLPAVARGAQQLILETKSFEPSVLFEQIQRHRVSHIAFLAPTQIVKMLDDYVPEQFDLSSLQAICYGGAPIYIDHLRRAVDTFGPVFAQIYGQGEAPITITGLTASAHAELLASGSPRIGSAGTIRTDVEVKVVDENDCELASGNAGEILARGDVVMQGYWNNPEATAETLRGGWLHTGDVGVLDGGGYLFLLDRAKDMIISGGNNVYPREVEEIIILLPEVANVVVLGIPDEYWGEAVHAVVVLEPDATMTPDQIIAHCAQHVAGYKKPKAVDFVDELPISGYGKVLRRDVRERYWAGQGRQIGGGVTSAAE